jgi:ribosomal protein S18 acetylase RimI-like enzyme
MTVSASALTIRDFTGADSDRVNHIALTAFSQFAAHYDDWPKLATTLSRMSNLALSGEIIVAEADGAIAGAVAYIPPGAPKASFFEPTWPVIRMLVADPAYRGVGIGRALTKECMRRARRDRAAVIALHTSPIMTVALPMYLRMGFVRLRATPPIFGVEYAVYTKML